MAEVRAMTYRDIHALLDVITEQNNERERQAQAAAAKARSARR